MGVNTYKYWTDLTRFCYERRCRCQGCCEFNNACRYKPMHINEYKLKPVKYAVIMTVRNIGVPNDERI